MENVLIQGGLAGAVVGALAVLISFFLYRHVMRQDPGTSKMQAIAHFIEEGARAYLFRQNVTLFLFLGVLAPVIGVLFAVTSGAGRGVAAALAYLLGAGCSTAAASLGMIAAVRANVRTAAAAQKGLKPAFTVAYFGGAVMGLGIVGMALLGISLIYYICRFGLGWTEGEATGTALGFSFGASALALFAKAGGGIYTKTADISADLVGKVELGIPEDDPRNPAVIADNVGDNVGDVAGMGADLVDSYIASIVAAMILGAESGGGAFTILPVLISAVGLLSSLFGTFIVRVLVRGKPGAAMNFGTLATSGLFLLLLFVVTYKSGLSGQQWLGVFLPTLAGLAAGLVIGLTTDCFTSIDRAPTRRTAEAASRGTAINILLGFSYGLVSIVPSILGICVATYAAWRFAEIFGVSPFYGIGISAVGMLSIVATIISGDAFGPVSDNARGIAEQGGLGGEVMEIVDALDAQGNTSKAITKGFAIGAAALTVLALFAAYTHLAGIDIMRGINLMSHTVIIGLFLGAMMPPLLSALLILAVGRNAERMIDEIRRQFREIPGLLAGQANPDYRRCVDIATRGALRELLFPCSLAIVVPVLVFLVLGKEALAAFLGGSILTGIIFALFMANSGGAWDNAKKYIENGAFGGKGSEAHKAAVVGDTVGDPFKDTAGPSLNTMITVMSLAAEVFVPIILLVLG
ncbi:MAG: sodium-translocating pyrophosphatase [Candidatus Bipolaricaulota bacterium]|nr:sodium-translocating pyrophosphatase [Candidatus Bipolaricaulota bacterium]MDW8126176.1 sodium-translocating pyrophosphatase [Candidatus Bipolaricaulota bacterium]